MASDAQASTPAVEGERGHVRGAAEVASRLRAAILEGLHQQGERLPAERQLATEFGVSRGTIRQALVELERIGLVTRRTGSGTFVRYEGSMRASDIAESISPMQLMEVRFALEPQMIRLAVVNATAKCVREVSRALEELRLADDPEAYTEADGQFHQALAECTQNPLMIWLYERINEVRGHSQWNAVKAKILTAQRKATYNDHHRLLYQALIGRDADRCSEIMAEHLAMTRSDILDAQQRSLGA